MVEKSETLFGNIPLSVILNAFLCSADFSFLFFLKINILIKFFQESNCLEPISPDLGPNCFSYRVISRLVSNSLDPDQAQQKLDRTTVISRRH